MHWHYCVQRLPDAERPWSVRPRAEHGDEEDLLFPQLKRLPGYPVFFDNGAHFKAGVTRKGTGDDEHDEKK